MENVTYIVRHDNAFDFPSTWAFTDWGEAAKVRDALNEAAQAPAVDGEYHIVEEPHYANAEDCLVELRAEGFFDDEDAPEPPKSKLSPKAQEIVDEIRTMMAPKDAGWLSSMVDDGVNHPTPAAMNALAELVTEHSIGWWLEEDENSPLEVIFDLADNLTFEDGMNISWAFRHVLFPMDVDYGPQYRLTGEGLAVRLMFEQPDPEPE